MCGNITLTPPLSPLQCLSPNPSPVGRGVRVTIILILKPPLLGEVWRRLCPPPRGRWRGVPSKERGLTVSLNL